MRKRMGRWSKGSVLVSHFLIATAPEKVPGKFDFTVIRKYLQQLIINADKQNVH
ncbi:MAG: hypothetical protein HFH39_12490 [Lachnospiraceae bacterium]|nr:hypothetical protein [Lachnospiraceae bacterium]